MSKCPCKECITLAICIHKDTIVCPILFEYIDHFRQRLRYPNWDYLLEDMCKILKGSWYPLALNDTTYAIHKNHYGANTDEG